MREPIRKKRKTTAKELAKKFGVCERTIRRYVAQDRATWEANSITRAAPWAAMGISRATWYNHGKPTTKQYEAVKHESSETNSNRT
jgi:predicted transcriptional regulator